MLPKRCGWVFDRVSVFSVAAGVPPAVKPGIVPGG